jgi:hypothetical protein
LTKITSKESIDIGTGEQRKSSSGPRVVGTGC